MVSMGARVSIWMNKGQHRPYSLSPAVVFGFFGILSAKFHIYPLSTPENFLSRKIDNTLRSARAAAPGLFVGSVVKA